MKPHPCFVAAALGMYFFTLNTTAHAQQIKAETGGVAIGRDVIQSTVVIGIPQEKVDELVRDCMSSEHFGQLAWQFKRMSGSSGLKVQAAIAC